jgi:metal-responsive CopG/Arc/MetJ family transcriptional regulator
MPRKKANYDARLSVLVETDLWYELEALARLRQLDGKSQIVRSAARQYVRSIKMKMSPEEQASFERILANIKEPATIEEITR